MIRFVRWQQILREHLTFLNNLGLAFSIATIAFLLSLLGEATFIPKGCSKLFFTIGLLSTLLSFICGFITSFSRLIDFRLTLMKIKNEKDGNSNVIAELKEKMGFYGRCTWTFFYFQVVLFCFAILNLSISFLIIYSDKLF